MDIWFFASILFQKETLASSFHKPAHKQAKAVSTIKVLVIRNMTVYSIKLL